MDLSGHVGVRLLELWNGRGRCLQQGLQIPVTSSKAAEQKLPTSKPGPSARDVICLHLMWRSGERGYVAK